MLLNHIIVHRTASRHLSFVRNAFGGIPTLAKEVIPPDVMAASLETSDIL